MSEQFEFTVRVGTTDSVDSRETAAELLQWLVSDGSERHDHINHVTVQYSEMDDYEVDRLLQMLQRFDDADIDAAIESVESLEEE